MRQLTPGLISSLSGTAGLPPFISFSTSYPDLDSLAPSTSIAGTDCGLGYRVGHEEIMWATLEAMVEGARIASKQLWVSR